MRLKLLFSIAAGLIFSTGDMAHIYFKIAQYPHWHGALFFNIPWWVPFEFAAATFLMIQFLPSPTKNTTRASLSISILWTLLIYLGSSLIPESHALTKNILLFAMLALQIAWQQMFNKRAIFQIMGVAVLGCGFEFMLGRIGIFSYFPSDSLIGTIPVWLPAIYGSATITVSLVHSSLQRFRISFNRLF